MGSDTDRCVRKAREVLSQYGKDYALGAVRSLAVRNMMSVDLPETSDGFYPIVKVHQMALTELEEVFYGFVQTRRQDVGSEDLILELVRNRVWE